MGLREVGPPSERHQQPAGLVLLPWNWLNRAEDFASILGGERRLRRGTGAAAAAAPAGWRRRRSSRRESIALPQFLSS